jgi:arylsulfatase A-like enzyme
MFKNLARSLEGIEIFRILGTFRSLVEINNIPTPDYVISPDRYKILKDYYGKGRSNYYSAIDCINSSKIQIKPKIQFSGLEFEILGMNSLESIDIEVTYFKHDNLVDSKIYQFENCDIQNFGYSFALSSRTSVLCDYAVIQFDFIQNQNVILKSILYLKNWFLSNLTHRKFVARGTPRVKIPVPTHLSEEYTPIILISIDSLRYDSIKNLQPLIAELGTTVGIPAEPRTKGHWTPPSHASMFTGVHPGDHYYTGIGHFATHPIYPNLVTIPEVLNSAGYKCTSIVSHTRILPESGFGRGFYRFGLHNMTNWLDRYNDSRTVVNRVLDQMEEDLESDENSLNLFYFLHIFDAHSPYVPIHPTGAIDDFNTTEYASLRKTRANFATAKDLYDISVRQVGHQIHKLIANLKILNIFDQSLIIITGDHGELFGEYESFGHSSLYDHNIRPLMMVKPPENADWRVPDECSNLDLLPTLARVAGESVPDQCQGIAWQEAPNERDCRITEGIYQDKYEIKVELNEISGIFTYESDNFGRPDQLSIDVGPLTEEYYNLNDARDGDYAQINDVISDDLKNRLIIEAEQFLNSKEVLPNTGRRRITVLEETQEQLEYLGYK